MGMDIKKIHAGKANMFLSPLFRDTLAGVSGATIELYDTDGSVGAAKGAGIGAGGACDRSSSVKYITVENSTINAKNIRLESLSSISSAKGDYVDYAGTGGGFIAKNGLYLTNNLNQTSEVEIKNSKLLIRA